MATKAKESALRKEKKVLPSSDSHTTHSLASSTKPAAARASSGSTTSGKAVPSYLRSTLSSRSEPPKLAKKPAGHEDAAQKATLLRRRSFDKPPSASPRIHSSFISPDPKERVASGVRVTGRSSSLTPKTSTSAKPDLDKTSKSPKLVKAQPPAATGRTLKGSTGLSRSRSLSNKKETHASHSFKGSDKHDVSGDHDLESKQESNQEPERTQTVESEVQITSDIPESKGKEHFELVITQVNDNVDEEHRPSDVSSLSKGQNVPETIQDEEAEGNLHEEEGSKKLDDVEENHQPGEAAADEAKVVAEQETLEEEANDDAGSSEESEEEKKKEVGEQGIEAKQEAKSKEGQEEVEVAAEEGKAEEAVTSNVTQKRQAGGQGKKESPAAYNNVIEETKKKLLEKKNSKVKALVGAFETVIDYESASK